MKRIRQLSRNATLDYINVGFEDDFDSDYDTGDLVEQAYTLAQEYFNVLSNKEPYEVALDNGEVVGASFVTEYGDFEFDVVVHPSHRRKGIAKELIRNAVQEFDFRSEADPEIVMQVDVVNPDMVNYMNSLGFVIKEQTKDHVIMEFEE